MRESLFRPLCWCIGNSILRWIFPFSVRGTVSWDLHFCDNITDFLILSTSEPMSRGRFGSPQLRSAVSCRGTCILQCRKSAPDVLQVSLSVEFMSASVSEIWYPNVVRNGGGSTFDFSLRIRRRRFDSLGTRLIIGYCESVCFFKSLLDFVYRTKTNIYTPNAV